MYFSGAKASNNQGTLGNLAENKTLFSDGISSSEDLNDSETDRDEVDTKEMDYTDDQAEFIDSNMEDQKQSSDIKTTTRDNNIDSNLFNGGMQSVSITPMSNNDALINYSTIGDNGKSNLTQLFNSAAPSNQQINFVANNSNQLQRASTGVALSIPGAYQQAILINTTYQFTGSNGVPYQHAVTSNGSYQYAVTNNTQYQHAATNNERYQHAVNNNATYNGNQSTSTASEDNIVAEVAEEITGSGDTNGGSGSQKDADESGEGSGESSKPSHKKKVTQEHTIHFPDHSHPVEGPHQGDSQPQTNPKKVTNKYNKIKSQKSNFKNEQNFISEKMHKGAPDPHYSESSPDLGSTTNVTQKKLIKYREQEKQGVNKANTNNATLPDTKYRNKNSHFTQTINTENIAQQNRNNNFLGIESKKRQQKLVGPGNSTYNLSNRTFFIKGELSVTNTEKGNISRYINEASGNGEESAAGVLYQSPRTFVKKIPAAERNFLHAQNIDLEVIGEDENVKVQSSKGKKKGSTDSLAKMNKGAGIALQDKINKIIKETSDLHKMSEPLHKIHKTTSFKKLKEMTQDDDDSSGDSTPGTLHTNNNTLVAQNISQTNISLVSSQGNSLAENSSSFIQNNYVPEIIPNANISGVPKVGTKGAGTGNLLNAVNKPIIFYNVTTGINYIPLSYLQKQFSAQIHQQKETTEQLQQNQTSQQLQQQQQQQQQQQKQSDEQKPIVTEQENHYSEEQHLSNSRKEVWKKKKVTHTKKMNKGPRLKTSAKSQQAKFWKKSPRLKKTGRKNIRPLGQENLSNSTEFDWSLLQKAKEQPKIEEVNHLEKGDNNPDNVADDIFSDEKETDNKGERQVPRNDTLNEVFGEEHSTFSTVSSHTHSPQNSTKPIYQIKTPSVLQSPVQSAPAQTQATRVPFIPTIKIEPYMLNLPTQYIMPINNSYAQLYLGENKTSAISSRTYLLQQPTVSPASQISPIKPTPASGSINDINSEGSGSSFDVLESVRRSTIPFKVHSDAPSINGFSPLSLKALNSSVDFVNGDPNNKKESSEKENRNLRQWIMAAKELVPIPKILNMDYLKKQRAITAMRKFTTQRAEEATRVDITPDLTDEYERLQHKHKDHPSMGKSQPENTTSSISKIYDHANQNEFVNRRSRNSKKITKKIPKNENQIAAILALIKSKKKIANLFRKYKTIKREETNAGKQRKTAKERHTEAFGSPYQALKDKLVKQLQSHLYKRKGKSSIHKKKLKKVKHKLQKQYTYKGINVRPHTHEMEITKIVKHPEEAAQMVIPIQGSIHNRSKTIKTRKLGANKYRENSRFVEEKVKSKVLPYTAIRHQHVSQKEKSKSENRKFLKYSFQKEGEYLLQQETRQQHGHPMMGHRYGNGSYQATHKNANHDFSKVPGHYGMHDDTQDSHDINDPYYNINPNQTNLNGQQTTNFKETKWQPLQGPPPVIYEYFTGSRPGKRYQFDRSQEGDYIDHTLNRLNPLEYSGLVYSNIRDVGDHIGKKRNLLEVFHPDRAQRNHIQSKSFAQSNLRRKPPIGKVQVPRITHGRMYYFSRLFFKRGFLINVFVKRVTRNRYFNKSS